MVSPFKLEICDLQDVLRVLKAANVSLEDILELGKQKPENIAAAIMLARTLHESGLTRQEVVKLGHLPEDVEAMLKFMRMRPSFRLIHGRFTPLVDKVEMVKSWPNIRAEDVDAAIALARENGTIAGFEAESPNNHLLDLVITVYRESIPATLLYGRERMKEVWGDNYDEWQEAYASGVDAKRVELIPGAREFQPNTIVVQAVDFGANWDHQHGNVLRDVQKAQAGQLADFAGLFNTSQSPKWVEQMDGVNVPYAILAALLLSMPSCDARSSSPGVWRYDAKAKLGGYHVDFRFRERCMAVVREYKN